MRLLKLPTGRGPSGPGSSWHSSVMERNPTTAAAGPASSPARTSAGGRPCRRSHPRITEAASGRAARRSRPKSRRRPCGSAFCPVRSGPSRSTGARARRIDTQVPTSPWRSSSKRVPAAAAAFFAGATSSRPPGGPYKASSPRPRRHRTGTGASTPAKASTSCEVIDPTCPSRSARRSPASVALFQYLMETILNVRGSARRCLSTLCTGSTFWFWEARCSPSRARTAPHFSGSRRAPIPPRTRPCRRRQSRGRAGFRQIHLKTRSSTAVFSEAAPARAAGPVFLE